MKNQALKSILFFLIFLAIGFFIYSNTLHAPFYLDDLARIKDNPSIRITNLSLKQIGHAAFSKNTSSKRPVTNITFALNYYFHQYEMAGYHIVNIMIHVVTAFLLFLFMRITLIEFADPNKEQPGRVKVKKSFSQTHIALAAALIWLVHPVDTNAVTYIVQRGTSLASMFFILSFLFYVKGRIAQRELSEFTAEEVEPKKQKSKQHPGSQHYKFHYYYLFFIGSGLSWMLALGSKQTAAMLPFFIFLYEWYFIQDLDKQWVQRNLKYVLVIVILFASISLLYLGLDPLKKITSITDFANNEFTFSERILTQFRVVIYYLTLFFYPNPSRLNLDYDFPLSHSLLNPFTTLTSLIAILGLIGLSVYIAKKERLLSFCIIWYFGNLLIESSIIPLAIIFEHRTYMPFMFVSLFVVILASRYFKKALFYPIVCIVIILFSFWTYQRNNVWADKLVFYKDCVTKSPNKARPHNNLGNAFAEQEQWVEAIHHLTEALRIEPNSEKAHNSLGSVLSQVGRYDEAMDQFLEVLKQDPENELAHYNLAVMLATQNKLSEAVNHYKEAIRLNPQYTSALINLGSIMAKQGFIDEAIQYYDDALKINPHDEELHFNLGVTLMSKGDLERAIQHLRTAIQINPDFLEAKENLNSLVEFRSKLLENITQIEDALKRDPKNPELYFQLGGLYIKIGKHDEAITQYQKALSIQPDFPQALHILAILYARKNEYDKSVSMFKKIVALDPENIGAYYNISCMYAKQHKIEESIDWLKKAIDKGYDKWDLIKTDNDLENIRQSSQYHDLIREH